MNEVVQGDSLAGLQGLADDSVDLIIADPPYNLSKGSRIEVRGQTKLPGMGGDWKKAMEQWDDMPLHEYFAFTMTWLSECRRVLKPTGSIWMFGSYHNIGVVNVGCQLTGIELINEVIWYKRNAFPNLAGRRLTASHENILWGHSGGDKNRKYFFDYEFSKNGDFSYDGLKSSGKQMRTVWDIPNNKARSEIAFGKHPTQKPLRLLRRMILMSSQEDDLVLVPFAGAGSECVAALELNRRFIGMEIDPTFVDIANRRLEEASQTVEQRNLF